MLFFFSILEKLIVIFPVIHGIFAKLVKYFHFSMVAMPFYIRHDLSFSEVSGGKLEITVGPQVTMGKAVSKIQVL